MLVDVIPLLTVRQLLLDLGKKKNPKTSQLHEFRVFLHASRVEENACPVWWAVLVTHLFCSSPCLIYEVLLSAASGKAD